MVSHKIILNKNTGNIKKMFFQRLSKRKCLADVRKRMTLDVRMTAGSPWFILAGTYGSKLFQSVDVEGYTMTGDSTALKPKGRNTCWQEDEGQILGNEPDDFGILDEVCFLLAFV